MHIIRVLSAATQPLYVKDGDVDYIPSSIRGQHLKAYTTTGCLFTTANINEAKKFADAAAASEFYLRQSTVLPLRPDGRPNRPFTAYTVSVEPEGWHLD
jgi:hypothetical protein